MKVFKMFLAGLFILPASAVMANVVSIGTVSGTQGAELTIPVTVDSNTDGIASIDIDVVYDDTQLVTRAGGSACGFIEPGDDLDTTKHGLACSEPAAGVLRVLINTLPALGNPPVVAMGTGEMVRLRFDILPGAAAPGTVALEAVNTDASDVDGNTIAGTVFNDGEVQVTEGPQSSLSIAPDPMAFGTVDLGNMPQTDTFTVTIGGDSGADDVTISNVALTTGAEFTIVADNCGGVTFTVPDTCTIDIQFDSAANGSFSDVITVTSDANVTPEVTADITGDADSVANISVTPPSGPVGLGFGAPGTTVSASGSFNNAGSADGEVSCSLTDPDSVFSTDPTPITGALVPAGGSLGFTLFCDLPELAEEGAEFFATLSCTGTNDFASEHQLSCGVSTFEAVPVPTMQAWTLALFAMLMLIIGGFSIRFFRAS